MGWLSRIFGRAGAARAEPAGAVAGNGAAPSVPVVAVGDVVVAPPPAVVISPDRLRAMGASNADIYASLLVKHMGPVGLLVSKQRAAMFFANVLHETLGFKRLTESLDYSADALRRQWPSHFTPEQAQAYGRTAAHSADQRAIAERAYGGRMGNAAPGDGWAYRGRGLMMTTGRDNYAAVQAATGLPVLATPDMLAEPDVAVRSACLYWQHARCNDPADVGDLPRVRKLINGGTIGLDDVRDWYQRVMRVL